MTIAERIKRGESFLVASDGQYLGKLTLNQFDYEGVLNTSGVFGSRYSATSIYNEFSIYGSKFSALSPHNPYTSTPPKIYLRGAFWGILTMNKYLYSMNSISPFELNEWMRIKGLYY